MGKNTLVTACWIALCAIVTSGALHADGRNPGSLLVFPAVRANAAGFSIVSVTNTHVQPQTPFSFGGSTNLHFEYYNVDVDPTDLMHPRSCFVFDRVEFLTPADTTSVLTACHNPIPGQGYLVVSAEDPSLFRTPWKHDHLVGSVLHITTTGATYFMPALSFEAGAALADGAATDLDVDSVLDFDGLEYELPPDTLLIDQFIAEAGTQLSLLNLSTDMHEVNQLYFAVWNDNEYPLSTTTEFSCWFDVPLSWVSPLFSPQFMRSLPNAPAELDINCDGAGDMETGWVRISSTGTRSGSTRTSDDGAFLGCLLSGPFSGLSYGKPLWESKERQPIPP